MAYLMGCGHVALGEDANGKPICPVCAGIRKEADVISKICKGSDGLEGRKARCFQCGHETNSKWELSFFSYNPNYANDTYYCGCRGFD